MMILLLFYMVIIMAFLKNIIVQWHSFRKDRITEFDTLNLQRTPLYIHMPGQTEGETISKPTGQIDIKPTILNLLGIDTTNDIRFGHDMFSNEYTGFVVLRDGSFITDKYAYKNNIFYDRITGEIVDLPKMKHKHSLSVRKMNYECLTKLLKAIYYVSQKVIRLKLVKYKLKLKKLKNNVNMKRSNCNELLPFILF